MFKNTLRTYGAFWEPIGNKMGTSWEHIGWHQKSKIVKLVAAKETGLQKLGLLQILEKKRKEHCNSDGLLSELVLVLMYRVIDLGRQGNPLE